MVILDIEVFKYDLLLGIKKYGEKDYKFYWNSEAKAPLEKLIESREEVISYNGLHYDLPLLYNFYFNKRNVATPFELSKYIVEKHIELIYPSNFWNSIDLFFLLSSVSKVSLKVIEAILGWEIRETTIDFRYEYKLTKEERKEVEHYNYQDLDACEALYNKMYDYLDLRRELSEYLGIENDYSIPLPTLMGMGLGAHREKHEPIPIHPLCLNVPIKHEIKNIMLEQMRNVDPHFATTFEMNGRTYSVANGGIHDQTGNWSGYDVFHVDVKGYYTLLQRNFGLWSRNIPPKGIDKINGMYDDRLVWKSSKDKKLKKKADSLKIGILATWGAMRNWHHILYDKYAGDYVTLYGQLFLIYLIELLSDENILIINANTDGVIVKGDEDVIRRVVKVWEAYGDFEVEIVKYKRFIQKDVNNYIMGNSLDKLKVKGRDFTAIKGDWLFANILLIPQTPVVSKLLSELLWYNEQEDFDPEAYVREHIKDYKVADYMFIIKHTMKFDGMRYTETQEELQRTNRVYANKNGYNVEKFKGDNSYKYPGLSLVKTCNEDLTTIDKDKLDIDYDWYVDEIMRKYVAYYE